MIVFPRAGIIRQKGNADDFKLAVDSDRFYGRFRDGVHQVDCSDLMRRMVKEEMVKFDGTPLFPERKAEQRQEKLEILLLSLRDI